MCFGQPNEPPPPPPVTPPPPPEDESEIARQRAQRERARRGRESLVIDPGVSIPESSGLSI